DRGDYLALERLEYFLAVESCPPRFVDEEQDISPQRRPVGRVADDDRPPLTSPTPPPDELDLILRQARAARDTNDFSPSLAGQARNHTERFQLLELPAREFDGRCPGPDNPALVLERAKRDCFDCFHRVSPPPKGRAAPFR